MTQAEAAAVAVMSLLAGVLVTLAGLIYFQAQMRDDVKAQTVEIAILRSRVSLVEAQSLGCAASLASLEAWRRARQGGFGTARILKGE
jgi:hypothetical protein